jgi:hypothetical protein
MSVLVPSKMMTPMFTETPVSTVVTLRRILRVSLVLGCSGA